MNGVSIEHCPCFQIDWILTKSYHSCNMMMGKSKNAIIIDVEDKALNIEKKDMEQYLSILSLTEMDFSEILQNEHKGFEHERLYVFGKDVNGGNYYGRAGKKGLLYYMQEGNRVSFTEKEHSKNDKR